MKLLQNGKIIIMRFIISIKLINKEIKVFYDELNFYNLN